MRADDGVQRRIVSLFSCGAASAVSTSLVIRENWPLPLVILNQYVKQEHPDNERFKQDCAAWFGHPITTQVHEKFKGDIIEVFKNQKYIKNRDGACCTRILKREIGDKFYLPGDVVILGYTADEQERFDKYLDAHPGMDARAPLIEYGLSKSDCLAIVKRQGIPLPAMYLLGFHNNNCIGCVKGGRGYWNKIRQLFPDYWEAVAQMQDRLGPGSYFWPGKKPGDPRISLRALPLDAGDYPNEREISCGAMCEMLEFGEREACE